MGPKVWRRKSRKSLSSACPAILAAVLNIDSLRARCLNVSFLLWRRTSASSHFSRPIWIWPLVSRSSASKRKSSAPESHSSIGSPVANSSCPSGSSGPCCSSDPRFDPPCSWHAYFSRRTMSRGPSKCEPHHIRNVSHSLASSSQTSPRATSPRPSWSRSAQRFSASPTKWVRVRPFLNSVMSITPFMLMSKCRNHAFSGLPSFSIR
mmetsp:Transcript_20517/g.57465  ORF Transcript_20517/g.57465 Transcript_20517/m.57465 type:complete len:207 (+) Transcript_20517:372-992(+)